MSFGIVSAGEGSPAATNIVVWNCNKNIFLLVGPIINVHVPQVYKKQLFIASCAEKTHEHWSHAPLFT